jgi:hypothetical protein
MWEHIQNVTNSFYKPGKFVTLIGYEWTNWTYGHMHVLFKGDRGKLVSTRSKSADTPAKLWKNLPPGNAITIPHHPAGGPIHINWSYYNALFESLVEISSIHGVSEQPRAPLSIYHPVAGAFVQNALARGYKLGFLGGGDSHNGHPGIPSVNAPVFGLSGVYARELTRASVWEAFTAKRTYATTGARIILEFSVNDARMGETVEAAVPLVISADAVPTAPIESFELIYNNSTVYRTKEPSIRYRHELPLSPGDYFYVRLIQNDKHMAWSSPVWLGACPSKKQTANRNKTW